MTDFNPQSITAPRRIETHRSTKIILRVFIYGGLALACSGGFFIARFLLWAKCLQFRAFRSGSASMCPAICENERFLVGMDAYNSHAPRLGDVIMFEFEPVSGRTNYVKRVAGLPGDTVARGPSNTILINGKPLVFPPPCGRDNAYRHLADWGPPFDPVRVPENSLFVIGDNLDDSYDSRFFGPISLDKVRGKALLVYWSPNTSRIGCTVQ